MDTFNPTRHALNSTTRVVEDATTIHHTDLRLQFECRACSQRVWWVRRSSVRRAHFRHRKGESCILAQGRRRFADDMSRFVDEQRCRGQTEWHRAWSRSVRPECREVRLHGRPRDAALAAASCIVEFQHCRMTQAEFSLRCAKPVARAVWIFDVTDRYMCACEGALFVDLPSAKFDFAYEADAAVTLLFQARDGCLYEAISPPFAVELNSVLLTVRVVRRFDARELPDVFQGEGETQAAGAEHATERPRAVDFQLQTPVAALARSHLPLRAAAVDERERRLRELRAEEARLAAEARAQRRAAEEAQRLAWLEARRAEEEDRREAERLAVIFAARMTAVLDRQRRERLASREEMLRRNSESQMQGDSLQG